MRFRRTKWYTSNGNGKVYRGVKKRGFNINSHVTILRWTQLFDDVFSPLIPTPMDCREIPAHPERRLWAAVLIDAYYSKNRRSRAEVVEWINSSSNGKIGGFAWVCNAAGVSEDKARTFIMRMMKKKGFRIAA